MKKMFLFGTLFIVFLLLNMNFDLKVSNSDLINTNLIYTPLSSTDSDGDGLPNDFEVKYGLDPYSASGDDGADGDQDNDQKTNYEEYSFNYLHDPIQMRVSPIDCDSDDDGHLDSLEIDFYNRYYFDTASQRVNPISSNTQICYEIKVPTSVYSLYYCNPTGLENIKDALEFYDGIYWMTELTIGPGTFQLRTEGLGDYSISSEMRNEYLKQVIVCYQVIPHKTAGTISNLRFRVKESDGTWQSTVLIASSPVSNQLYEGALDIDTIDDLKGSKWIDSIEIQMYASPGWFQYAHLYLDYVSVAYIF